MEATAEAAYASARAAILEAAESGDELLNLSSRGLASVPPEVGMLKAVRHLQLSGNALETLPPEIGDLPRLRYLSLENNRLARLPPEFGRLAGLEQVNLDHNELTVLPPEIGNLVKLDWLSIDHNRLVALPPEIGDLPSLRTLMLDDNELTTLPARFAQLPVTLELRLRDNPLEDPLPQLYARGLRDLMAHVATLDEAEPEYEARILLLGEGAVGKTSLAAALQGLPFVQGRSTTHGIEIGTLRLPHPELPTDITLNLWDFGGQEVYRVTHQFFFSRRALYVVVWNPRQGQEQNEVEGWLQRIQLRAGEGTRVLVVATHVDERSPEIDYPGLRLRYGAMLADSHHGVDNESGAGLDRLREALAREAARLDQMGERIHPRWKAARDEVRRHPAPQITRGEFEEICARHQMDDAEAATLANHLHDLGHIVHYADEEGLKDVVVLQPEWLTKAISYVLEDVPTREAGGVLDHGRLREIWRDRDGRTYPAHHHPYFLRLMEKFDVSYRLEDQPSSLIPQLVAGERPPLPWRRVDTPPEGVRKLALICTMNQEPPGLIAWLTVRNNRFAKGVHWRRGVLLAHDAYGSEALFEMLDGARLSLTVRAPSPDHFFAILRDSVEYLIERRWPGLEYDFLVPCPTVLPDGSRCQGEFEFRFLTRYRERRRGAIECRQCMEDQSIAELLTGFPATDVPLRRVNDEVNAQFQRVRADIDQLAGNLDARLDEIKGIAASGAGHIRAVLRAVGAEIQDCPRLFTLASVERGRLHPARLLSSRLRLTLWCEHPGAEHAWPEATYEVSEPHAWLRAAAPYALLVVRTLQVIVPVAGAVPGLVMQEDDAKAIQAHIDLTKAAIAALPEIEVREGESLGENGQITAAEGRGLRALRALLVDEEGALFGTFGGLRRVLTPAGDWVWVCPHHYHDYDPGLPVLPAD